MNRNIRRGVVALAAVLAHLAILAGPASAGTVTGPVTGGSMILTNSTGTITDVIPVGGATGGTDCSSSAQVNLNGTATSVTTWQITGYTTVFRFGFYLAWYVAVETWVSSTPGTVTGITGTSATLNSAGLTLRLDIYLATDQSDSGTSCAHGTTRRCRFGNVNLTVAGTYQGNIHNPATSDTITFAGAGTLGTTTPPCVAPFTTYTNGTVAFTNVTIHLG